MAVWDVVGAAFAQCKPIGRAIMEVAAPAARELVGNAKRLYGAVCKAIREEFRPPPKTAKEKLERELEEINDRVQALRKRKHDRGSLTEREDFDWQNCRTRSGACQ